MEIRIAKYENEAAYRLFKPEEIDKLSYMDHCKMIDDAVKKYDAEGHDAALVTIKIDEYLDWLSDTRLENTTTSRARFAAEVTQRCGTRK